MIKLISEAINASFYQNHTMLLNKNDINQNRGPLSINAVFDLF
jgi:hypothetical protein